MYDLIVIGGGPGGYTAAIRAAKLGMRTALVEERELGGTCLNRGCIPTKALLHSSEIFSSRHCWQELGISAQNVAFDQSKAYAHKESLVSGLRQGIESLVRANKIDLYFDRASLLDKNTVMVGEKRLNAAFILLASGSRPQGYDPNRPISGIENALNSDHVLANPIEGDSVIIIGAGVIGVELASYFIGIGKNVTLIASGDRIIRMMSRDMSMQLAAVLKKSGIRIITGAVISEVTDKSVSIELAAKPQTIEADCVISALGRVANVEGLGLENAGVAFGKFISTDANMRTNVPNIYACGDVTGGIQLAHYAAAAGITAVESMLDMPHSMDLSVVPSCIYTSPEIAVVGKKETDVQNAKVGKFMMGANAKSLIEGINRGYVKVIADECDVVVGAEIFGIRATDIIGELALAISAKMNVSELAKVIHAHPTVYESILEACEDVHGLATHMMPKKS